MSFSTLKQPPWEKQEKLKTYVFEIRIEQNDDGRWSAECPMLPGCATWGRTRSGALNNIHEAAEGYVADMLVTGEPVPGAADVLDRPAVSVTVYTPSRAG